MEEVRRFVERKMNVKGGSTPLYKPYFEFFLGGWGGGISPRKLNLLMGRHVYNVVATHLHLNCSTRLY